MRRQLVNLFRPHSLFINVATSRFMGLSPTVATRAGPYPVSVTQPNPERAANFDLTFKLCSHLRRALQAVRIPRRLHEIVSIAPIVR